MTLPYQLEVADSLDGSWKPWEVGSYKPGQTISFGIRVFQGGALVDAPANELALVLCDPNGVITTQPVPTHDAIGKYDVSAPVAPGAAPGVWFARAVLVDSVAPTLVEKSFYVDASAFAPTTSPVPPPSPVPGTILPLVGPITITGVPNTIYACDASAGSIVINWPTFTAGQFGGVMAVAGVDATHSITSNFTGPQVANRPAPFNMQPPVASYAIGGPTPSSGAPSGAMDAGTAITWAYGGIGNALGILP